jgi:dUTP pyrophosphatase
MSLVEIYPNSILSKRAGDLGYDVVASSDPIINFEKKYIEYETNFRFAPETESIHAFFFPRSSISNTWLMLANGVGVIDSSYRGQVKARFRYFGDLENVDYEKIYKKGDKILQCVFFEEKPVFFVEAENLKETERGESGFGSTDS